MDGLGEALSRDFGKLLPDSSGLERLVLRAITRVLTPPVNPEPTEGAVSIEHQQWLARRRGHACIIPAGGESAMRHRDFLPCLAAVALTFGLSHPAAGQLASRPAEEWSKTLEQPTRIAGLKVDEIVAKLGLKPGNVVADLGAGTGVFDVQLAKAVSPGGKVYAVDIDAGFFDFIQKKAAEAHVTNIQTVLGKFADPTLPARDLDVAFFHDVLHHVQDRAAYLKRVAGYLKPTGRVAIIDYKGGQGPHREQPDLQATEGQVNEWLTAAGLKLSETIELFPDKYYVVYSKR